MTAFGAPLGLIVSQRHHRLRPTRATRRKPPCPKRHDRKQQHRGHEHLRVVPLQSEQQRLRRAPNHECAKRADHGDRPLTDAGVLYTLSGVRQAGPFVVVGVTSQERMPRRPGEAPQLFAAGTTYYLMELNGEWVIVSTDMWVT